MLKGIPHILSPELLKIIAEMGHGDDLVIGDCNFPSSSTGRVCVRADGVKGIELLDAILTFFPLDSFVEAPVTLMRPTPGSIEGEPPAWAQIREIVNRHQPGARIGVAERFAFYDLARKAYATVATSEMQYWACMIIKKGVLIQP